MTLPAKSFAVAVLAVIAAARPTGARLPHLLDLPPRYMWGWEEWSLGYCGEMSLQTAGIYYGNWLNQAAVRLTSGFDDPEHFLELEALHGNRSFKHACDIFKLECSAWDLNRRERPQHDAFLAWSRTAIDHGWPVLFSVYQKGDSDPVSDHYVPMVGYDDTAIYFNDLNRSQTLRSELSMFVQTRRTCNYPSAPEWCLPRDMNAGLRVHGNADVDHVLLPIRLLMSSWKEPDFSKEDRQHEAPTLLTAKLNITGLSAGLTYVVLRYSDPNQVPDRDFLNSKFDSKFIFKAAGDVFTQSVTFMSNSTTFFRCIRDSAEPLIV